ncbi:54S ribosomal protein L8, mitochondrial, partial [Cryomyces antarcticus]
RPLELVPKLFGPIRERYASRPGGYTRVLRIEPIKEDQASSAILELVDGPKDMRFAMTARTIARTRVEGKKINDITASNIAKVTRYREEGEGDLERMVSKFEGMLKEGEKGVEEVRQKKVYPKLERSR